MDEEEHIFYELQFPTHTFHYYSNINESFCYETERNGFEFRRDWREKRYEGWSRIIYKNLLFYDINNRIKVGEWILFKDGNSEKRNLFVHKECYGYEYINYIDRTSGAIFLRSSINAFEEQRIIKRIKRLRDEFSIYFKDLDWAKDKIYSDYTKFLDAIQRSDIYKDDILVEDEKITKRKEEIKKRFYSKYFVQIEKIAQKELLKKEVDEFVGENLDPIGTIEDDEELFQSLCEHYLKSTLIEKNIRDLEEKYDAEFVKRTYFQCYDLLSEQEILLAIQETIKSNSYSLFAGVDLFDDIIEESVQTLYEGKKWVRNKNRLKEMQLKKYTAEFFYDKYRDLFFGLVDKNTLLKKIIDILNRAIIVSTEEAFLDYIENDVLEFLEVCRKKDEYKKFTKKYGCNNVIIKFSSEDKYTNQKNDTSMPEYIEGYEGKVLTFWVNVNEKNLFENAINQGINLEKEYGNKFSIFRDSWKKMQSAIYIKGTNRLRPALSAAEKYLKIYEDLAKRMTELGILEEKDAVLNIGCLEKLRELIID